MKPLLTVAIVLLLASCSKTEFTSDNTSGEELATKALQVDKSCSISQIYSPYNIARFSYNSQGDPISIMFDFVGTGSPNLFFK